MIRIVNGAERTAFPREMDEMFKTRALVFRDRLNWEVEVDERGWEIDEYDEENPLYLLSIENRTGAVRGSLRLLPTAGRHMMRDVFQDLFDLPVLIESATIWECTRFCVHPDWASKDYLTASGVNRVTLELLMGICEVGLDAGATQILGVFDRLMPRVYRRAGWTPDIIGQSDRASCGSIFVGLWDVTEEALTQMQVRAGSKHSVFDPEPPDIAAAA